ncbi:MAG: META domain-containing protein [Roseinatronobacter sp.]
MRRIFLLVSICYAFFSPALAQDTSIAPPKRDISGAVLVLERMALPETTVLIVDVTTAEDGAFVSKRIPTEGSQSPFAFAVDVPVDTALILRAGLRAGDDMVWLTEPRLIEAADTPLDLGEMRAQRVPVMGFSSILLCGTQMVEIGFLPDEVRLRFNEQILTMRTSPAASGAYYVAVDNPATSLHLKEGSGVLIVDGATLAECALVRPEQDITAGVWNISAIGEKPTMFPSRTELVFFPDGRVSASVGCNRFIGGYRRHGGFLSIGRVASTRMGCPDGLAEQEKLFSGVLQEIDGYSLSSDGTRLTLTATGVAVLQARR